MKQIVINLLALVMIAAVGYADTEYYTVKRSSTPITVDGVLDEPEWSHAGISRAFVVYSDSSMARMHTQVQLLWDDDYLYAAMWMNDRDVWATISERDGKLYLEEVAEIFIDADGDGLNYIEIEVNPLGTMMDILMNKEYAKGGNGDWAWNFDHMKAVVSVKGSLYDDSDSDDWWILECAIPFSEVAPTAPSMTIPPKDGDEWRANFYRYERDRSGSYDPELTAWNPTGPDRGFHAPDKFGRLIFSSAPVMGTGVDGDYYVPAAFEITGIYPNPFNPLTEIRFRMDHESDIRLDVFSVTGQRVRSLVTGRLSAGAHSIKWDGLSDDGRFTTSGVYLARLSAGSRSSVGKMLLVR